MIVNIRHKGLKWLYDSDDPSGLRHDLVKRIRRALTVLDAAKRIEDVDALPGMRLHPLKGDYAGAWSISVSGNWRIVFRFEEGEAHDVDLVDYH